MNTSSALASKVEGTPKDDITALNVENKKSETSFPEILGNKAARFVVISTVIIVMMIISLLFFQVHQLTNSTKEIYDFSRNYDLNRGYPDKSLEGIQEQNKFLLEKDAQYLRTLRGQSLVSLRLNVIVSSILTGLSLIVLGSSFIFARIHAQSSAEAQRDGDSVKFNTVSPGVMLALLGTIIVVVALWAAFQSKAADKGVVVKDGNIYYDPIKMAAVPTNSLPYDENGKFDMEKAKEIICANDPKMSGCSK